MTTLGTIKPKLIARMIVTAVMPSENVAARSSRVVFEPLVSITRPLVILKRKTPGIIWTPTPPSLQHKYVIEDVPCGLVAMWELGRTAGVATPVIDGLITLTSMMLRRDCRSEGRNLARLALAGKTVGEIRSIVETGLTG